MLTTRFEEIRINNEEFFNESYTKANDIVRSSFNLGERIPEAKIGRKIIKSLPKRIRPKVTTIKERKDLDTIKIEELVGFLQTYELKKNKSLALNNIKEESSNQIDKDILRVCLPS